MKKSSLQTLIGFTLLSGIVLFYNFFSENISESDIKYFEGELNTQGRVASHGGETEHNYYILSLKGFEKEFHFRSCAFQKLNLSQLDIGIGDKVSIGVIEEREDYYQSIVLNVGNQKLLTVDDINTCKQTKYRIWIFVFSAMLIILVVQILKWVIRK